MKLFGVAGTNGSGKDTVGQILAEQHNFLFISVTDMLRAEAKKRGWAVEREQLKTISAEWRRESGLGVLVDKAVAEYEKAGGDSKYTGLVIASLRNPGENDSVHKLGGKVVWVDADPKVRFERVSARLRSAEDKKTFEQFLLEEQAEMQHSGDSATLSISGVKATADIFIKNNSTPEAFKDEIKKALL